MNSEELGSVVELVAADVRRCMAVLTRQPVAACLPHAKVGQEFLRAEGVDTRLVIGEAVWRVGNGDSDVVGHSKKCDTVAMLPGGRMFHTWLEHDDHIIDFTTYTLPIKAQLIDAVDSRRVKVLWCPDFLYVPKSSVSSFPSVRDKHAGLYHYHRNSALEHSVLRHGGSFQDAVDMASVLRSLPSDCKP